MPNYAMKSKGENINHYNAVRLRVIGTGTLNLRMNSLNDVVNQDLLPLTMTEETNIEPTRLCNFKQQRARLHLYVDGLGDFFKITRIVVFAKPVATSYPG